MTTLLSQRVHQIEAALSQALSRGDFEVITHDGERFLEPVMHGHMIGDCDLLSVPRLSLYDVARDLERALS